MQSKHHLDNANSLSLVLKLLIYIVEIGINLPLFSTVLPSNSCCFCPVGHSLLIQHFQRPTGQKQQLLEGRTLKNKGKLILTEIFPSGQTHDI